MIKSSLFSIIFLKISLLGLPETELKVLQIDCSLPRDYPSKQPPQIAVSSQGFLGIESHREFLKLLAEELQAGGTLFTQGEPCVHGAIQWIQDNVFLSLKLIALTYVRLCLS